MSLGRKTVRGLLWNYLSFAGGKALTFVSTIILARLLGPEEFGLVAIALLAVMYLDAVGDLGIAAALIYQKDNVERAAHVAFIINLLMGITLWLAATLTSPLIASYFGEPAVTSMLRVLAVTFVIQSIGNVPMALMEKELDFRRKLAPDLAKSFTKGAGSIILALLGWGAWSLVWGQVLGVLAQTVMIWIVQPWRPRFVWDFPLGRRLLDYGLQVVLIEILAVVWSTADYTIIARLLGSRELGLYQQAFRVSDLLILYFCFMAGRVLFPSYTKLNHDQEALRKGFLATLRYVSLITLPVSAGLVAVAPVFVSAVFDREWMAMVPALQWLAVRAGIATLSFNSGHIFRAIGRPGIINKQMVVKLAVMIPVLLFSVQYGFVGVAMGQVAVAVFSFFLEQGTVVRIIEVRPGAMWREIQVPLGASLVMGLVVWLFAIYSPAGYVWIRLISGVLLGAAVYLGILWITRRHMVLESARTLIQVIRPERRAPVES